MATSAITRWCVRRPKKVERGSLILENPYYCLSMIFSENRSPLFGIML
jgi:hypothetical protein